MSRFLSYVYANPGNNLIVSQKTKYSHEHLQTTNNRAKVRNKTISRISYPFRFNKAPHSVSVRSRPRVPINICISKLATVRSTCCASAIVSIIAMVGRCVQKAERRLISIWSACASLMQWKMAMKRYMSREDCAAGNAFNMLPLLKVTRESKSESTLPHLSSIAFSIT